MAISTGVGCLLGSIVVVAGYVGYSEFDRWRNMKAVEEWASTLESTVPRVARSVVSAPTGRSTRKTLTEADMTPNDWAADKAIRSGRAKCVWGTVYSTSDHRIEPWVGGVKCLQSVDGTFAVPTLR